MEYDRSWDIEEYLDNGIIEVISSGKKEFDGMVRQFKETLKLLVSTGNFDLLRRFKDGKFQGRVGQAAFETIFLGVSQNLRSIRARANPGDYVLKRAKALWARTDVQEFTKAGQRGTDRIQKTIPFGKMWFAK